jgi:hypothetical protein
MNTKNITDKKARKEEKRKARKEAPPVQPRAAGEARGSNKKKVRTIAKGQRKR